MNNEFNDKFRLQLIFFLLLAPCLPHTLNFAACYFTRLALHTFQYTSSPPSPPPLDEDLTWYIFNADVYPRNGQTIQPQLWESHGSPVASAVRSTHRSESPFDHGRSFSTADDWARRAIFRREDRRRQNPRRLRAYRHGQGAGRGLSRC